MQLLCLRDQPCLTLPEVPVPPSSGPTPRSLCLLGMLRSGGSDPHVPRLQRTGPWSLSRRLQPAPRRCTGFRSVGVRMFVRRCLGGQASERVAWGPPLWHGPSRRHARRNTRWHTATSKWLPRRLFLRAEWHQNRELPAPSAGSQAPAQTEGPRSGPRDARDREVFSGVRF